MDIIISNGSEKAIYEQIVEQIKMLIVSGELIEGAPIPTMRSLAKSLQVSVITVQHAYEILQREGYLKTNVGRGSYVSKPDKMLVQKENLKKIELLFREVIRIGKVIEVEKKDLLKMFVDLYEEK